MSGSRADLWPRRARILYTVVRATADANLPVENRMRLSQFRRAAILTLTAGTLVGTSGCFGSFNLTRKVYGFNKTVSKDKFVQELVFLGLNVVPIYGIAGFIDVVVANTVEFWTGTNPIEMSSTIRVDGTTSVKRALVEKDGVQTMTLNVFKADKFVGTTTVKHVLGANQVTFVTLLADGRTESHVATLGLDGKAFVSSATYANPQRANVNAQR
jgi:hypothetical protein